MRLLASAAGGSPDIVLDVIRLADRGERFLRIRKSGQAGKPGLAALLPASLLLPQASMQGGRLLAYAHIALADGTPVGTSGVAPDRRRSRAQFFRQAAVEAISARHHRLDAAQRRHRRL